MPTSNPSKEIYVVDVPEVKDFSCAFQYNYFVPDEKTNEQGGIPSKFSSNSTNFFDPDVEEIFASRVPRFVKIQWTNASVQGSYTSQDSRGASYQANKNIISNNLSKIVYEDSLSSRNFVGVTFQDAELNKKIFFLLSGTLDQLRLNQSFEQGLNQNQAVSALRNSLTPEINQDFIVKGFSQSEYSQDSYYYSGMSQGSSHDEKVSLKNLSLLDLQNVYLSSKIDSSMAIEIASKIMSDPQTSYDVDLHEFYTKLSENRSFLLNNVRIEPVIEPISYTSIITSMNNQVGTVSSRNGVASNRSLSNSSQVVGYVIDKYEILEDGTSLKLNSLVVEDSSIGIKLDPFVKYGQNYCYSIRAISLFKMIAIDSETSNLGLVDVLVSSKPVKRYIKISDSLAPQQPVDIRFFWDYESENLVINWSFPVNPQRDIKKFQVFRRKNLSSAFELLKEYDFDDSTVKTPNNENPDRRLVQRLNSPLTSYVDDDFTKDSTFIYAICSVDAHGLTSCYSSQFEIAFDKFKNELLMSQVSHSGAPKQYPNLYVKGQGFANVGHVNGNYSKRAFLYFTPQYYKLRDNDGMLSDVISTNKTGGSYKFQFINVDNQKSEILSIKIDDRITNN